MNNLATLQQYHVAYTKLEDIESGLKHTEARKRFNKVHRFLTEQQEAVTSLTEQLAAKSAKLNDMQATVAELEHDYALEISDFEIMETDEECTSEEVMYSRQSMEKLLSRIKTLSKELMDTLTWIDRAAHELADAKQKGRASMGEYTALRTECEEERKAAMPAIEAAKKGLVAIEAALPRELSTRYKSIRRKFANPMVTIENNQCGGCKMQLPSVVIRKVCQQNELVICENCGRILYDSAVAE